MYNDLYRNDIDRFEDEDECSPALLLVVGFAIFGVGVVLGLLNAFGFLHV